MYKVSVIKLRSYAILTWAWHHSLWNVARLYAGVNEPTNFTEQGSWETNSILRTASQEIAHHL
jgi:hypothetical protein